MIRIVMPLVHAAVAAGLLVAQAPSKIAVINIQGALIGTRDGQKAAQDLQSRFEPRRKGLEAKQSEIGALQQELAKGSNTMAEAKRVSLTRDIDQKTKSLQRESQDAQDEFEQEQNKLLNELGQRMMVVLDKYAKENNFALVVDISQQQSPVIWAANGADITQAIVALYDANSTAPSAGGAAASPAAAPKPASAPPPAPSPAKKVPSPK